jgi:hypothetical protein
VGSRSPTQAEKWRTPKHIRVYVHAMFQERQREREREEREKRERRERYECNWGYFLFNLLLNHSSLGLFIYKTRKIMWTS